MKHYRKIEHVSRHGLFLLARPLRVGSAAVCLGTSRRDLGVHRAGDAVTEGETQSIDETLLLSLRNPADHTDPLGPG
ncbi:hypothetical protein [Halomonas chromatireducens]|uniref:Uncharacterized protein n=1 Tax=Halomonas chromatireducens TaxID=507626 RepID=A0A109UKU6_9GAMM|nr:hypothetical protein [Halomonas chromatireducens]AMC99463.1 hypothetical protein LOKO_00367 [Halomonas chromatireducens]